jgi:hypothetical protein
MMEGIMGRMMEKMIGNELSPNICMHVTNLTLVMLGASLDYLSPTLELRIK